MNAPRICLNHLRVAGALLTLAAGSAFVAPLAYGQQASSGLEEVVVTATRRAETNLQITPVSVSAVTSTDIERMVAKDIAGIASSVPGFSAARVTAFNAASFAMRGVGITDIIVYQDSPVGVQVDDFVMPSVQTQLLDTFDIASAEVLRGPQGTLFGKNTTGGAVNIRTKRPNMHNTAGEVRLGFAKFGEVNGQGALDLPIVDDKFAIRLVGSYIKTDGYYRLGATYGPLSAFAGPIPGITGTSGSGSGARTGGQDVLSGRAKAQWNVNDNLTALLQYELLRDRSDAVPSFNDTGRPPPAPPAPYVWNFLGFTSPAGDPLDHVASTNRSDQLIQMNKGQKIDVDGAYLNLDWKLGSNYTVYSNTGFRKQKEHLPNTYTGAAPINTINGTVLSLFDASRDTNRDTFQQEVRLASSLSGPFNYVAGAFYQRNDARFCVVQYVGVNDFFVQIPAFNDPQYFNNNPKLICNKQKSKSIAGFVDGTYDVTDKLQVGGGFRWTRDEKEWNGRTGVQWQALKATPFPLSDLREPLDAADYAKYPGGTIVDHNTPGFSNLKTKWSEPSWRLTGSYKFTPTVFGYATVSRGYKAGGYNDQTGSNGFFDSSIARPVNPEFATNYELGMKSQWLNNRLRVNPTIYYVKYSDAQRAANITAVNNGATNQETVFYNAAEVTSKGAELELQALVSNDFLLRVAASYLDANYDKFKIDQPQIGNAVVNPTCIGVATCNGIVETHLDLTGLPVPRSPKESGSVMGTYTFGLANSSKLEATGEVYYESKNLYYISAVTPPAGSTNATSPYNAYLDSKTLLHVSLAWTSANGKYFARLYGRNLTDRRYRVASQSVATLWTHTQFGEPRNYGIQFGAKFGGGR